MTKNFGAGGLKEEDVICEYPSCNERAIIPIPTNIPGHYNIYCYKHSMKIEEEKREKEMRELILKMKDEGLLDD